MKKSRYEVIPAILEKDFKKITEKFKRLKKSFGVGDRSFYVQVDICDGSLTPEKTFLSSGRQDSFVKLKKVKGSFRLELDMIVDFRENSPKLDRFLLGAQKGGAQRLIFHLEGMDQTGWEKVFTFCRKNKIEVALGVWLSHKNSQVASVLQKYAFSYIQIMGIEQVGYGSQKISKKVFEKAEHFQNCSSKTPIQVDGGVKVENTPNLTQSGVTRLVSGSGIFSAIDIEERVRDFKKEI